MRRIALIISLAGVLTAIALIVGATAQGSDTYKFDVIFDDARGLIAGQVVKIAGAQAGTVNNVVVTKNFKARVEASITGPFQFHQNATCVIRQEGLIGEDYVDCDPGSASSPLLRSSGAYPPTVPVQNTTEPVSLLDLFDIFNVPTSERLQVLLDEFGIATAGEGDNVNAILNRANPTLHLADEVIAVLDRQKAQLVSILDQTATIARSGAAHTPAVQAFLKRAASLTELTADHSSNLSLAIHRLPTLLSAATPALSQLDTVARDGTPLLQNIRTAVPYLNEVNDELTPFVKVATPALSHIGTAIGRAIPAIRIATPLVKELNNYVKLSAPNTALFAKLAANLIEHGFSENFFSVVYYTAASLARYDSTSHVLSLMLEGPDNGACASYATTPVAACSAHYGSATAFTPERKSAQRSAHRTTHRAAKKTAASPKAPGTTPPTTSTTSAPTTVGSVAGSVGKVVSSLPGTTTTTVKQTGQALQNLVNYLLK